MSKIHALKFLILQTLSKNKSKLKNSLHSEIANSLKVIKNDETLNISWSANNKNKEILIDKNEFNFYVKSEFNESSNVDQINDNEDNAFNLVSKIIEISSG